MDPTCLEHALTGAERDHFNEQGYLHLKQMLDPGQIDHLTGLTDNIWKTAIDNGLGTDKNLFFPNFIGRDQTYINLVDHPRVLPKIWGVLGWNIYLYHSHLGVTHQEAPEGTPISYPLGFHQDSGRVNADIECHPRPRLSLKVSYWLSDVSQTGPR